MTPPRPPESPAVIRAQDESYLQVLSVLSYVWAAWNAICFSVPLLYVGIGVMVLFTGKKGGPAPPPAAMGWFFILFGGFFTLLGWCYSVAMAYAGRSLSQHRNFLLCQIMFGVSCIFLPLGTTLGIFGLITLSRPSVHALFMQARAEQDAQVLGPEVHS